MRNRAQNSEMVQSISRAIEIIKCLSAGEDRLIDICRGLKLGKSTVHRLLKTLEASGLVAQDPVNRRYYLGHLFISLASNPMIMHEGLTSSALDEMKRLRDFYRETVALQIRTGVHRMFLEELESPQNSKLTVGKGNVLPLQTGSGGKILLSELKADELELILKHIRTDWGKSPSIEITSFIKELETVKKQGYALSIDGVQGSAAISVPVRNYECPVALTILGPRDRFRGVTAILPEMKKSADRIGRRLIELRKST